MFAYIEKTFENLMDSRTKIQTIPTILKFVQKPLKYIKMSSQIIQSTWLANIAVNGAIQARRNEPLGSGAFCLRRSPNPT